MTADDPSSTQGQSTIDALVADGRIVSVTNMPPRIATFARTEKPISPRVAAALGTEQLWSHQAEAIDKIRAGQSVVIATGTASGKSRCYQIPIAEAAIETVMGTSLALFPTKALAQDQLRAMYSLGVQGLSPATFDGDSNYEQRDMVRATANVLLTNPEMLHGSILPSHTRWATFLSRLQYVVIDELHVLRGVFGSHVGHVLRRLRRMCEHYGSKPTFIFTSATIGKPEILASELCGLPVEAISDDGSPQAVRKIVMLNPPVVDEMSGARTSANAETASVAAEFIKDGLRTIVFCRSRKGTELVAADISRRLPEHQRQLIKPYRSGYLASERRTIEHELSAGTLRAVVATSAMELGIDVGGLDACVLNGFPGTVSSMWQQIGRAGRGRQNSVSVLVAGDDQLDQWVMNNSSEMLNREPEQSVVNMSNPFVLGPHLACAAAEKPLSYDDETFWGDSLADGIREMVVSDKLALKPSGTGQPVAVYTGGQNPSRSIGLRSGGGRQVSIVDRSGNAIGTVDSERAPNVVHKGAIYLHQGKPYEVVKLDLPGAMATVRNATGETFTQTRNRTDIALLEEDDSATIGDITVHLGSVEVTTEVYGYQVKEARSRRILANYPLELPPGRLLTRAFWYQIPVEVIARAGLVPDQVPGALHAAEHCGIGILPLFTICDRWDVGGVSTAWHEGTDSPTIFIYDAHPGGAGIAELGFASQRRHLTATLESIEACGCADGCPSCVQSPKCGNGNEPLDKYGAAALLTTILKSASNAG